MERVGRHYATAGVALTPLVRARTNVTTCVGGERFGETPHTSMSVAET
jgi:hypothetical protein